MLGFWANVRRRRPDVQLRGVQHQAGHESSPSDAIAVLKHANEMLGRVRSSYDDAKLRLHTSMQLYAAFTFLQTGDPKIYPRYKPRTRQVQKPKIDELWRSKEPSYFNRSIIYKIKSSLEGILRHRKHPRSDHRWSHLVALVPYALSIYAESMQDMMRILGTSQHQEKMELRTNEIADNYNSEDRRETLLKLILDDVDKYIAFQDQKSDAHLLHSIRTAAAELGRQVETLRDMCDESDRVCLALVQHLLSKAHRDNKQWYFEAIMAELERLLVAFQVQHWKFDQDDQFSIDASSIPAIVELLFHPQAFHTGQLPNGVVGALSHFRHYGLPDERHVIGKVRDQLVKISDTFSDWRRLPSVHAQLRKIRDLVREGAKRYRDMASFARYILHQARHEASYQRDLEMSKRSHDHESSVIGSVAGNGGQEVEPPLDTYKKHLEQLTSTIYRTVEHFLRFGGHHQNVQGGYDEQHHQEWKDIVGQSRESVEQVYPTLQAFLDFYEKLQEFCYTPAEFKKLVDAEEISGANGFHKSSGRKPRPQDVYPTFREEVRAVVHLKAGHPSPAQELANEIHKLGSSELVKSIDTMKNEIFSFSHQHGAWPTQVGFQQYVDTCRDTWKSREKKEHSPREPWAEPHFSTVQELVEYKLSCLSADGLGTMDGADFSEYAAKSLVKLPHVRPGILPWLNPYPFGGWAFGKHLEAGILWEVREEPHERRFRPNR